MRYKKKIYGTKNRPRLSVFRSNKHIYAQIIDDDNMRTLVASNSLQLKAQKQEQKDKKTKKQVARDVGELLAKKAVKKAIKKVVFDRGRYKYHGKIKELAKGAREGGLDF